MRLIDGDQFFPNAFFQVPYYAIENAPTVDAVPVVRCRECKHYDGEYCTNPYGLKLPGPRSFCDCGQRKGQSADVRKKDGGGADDH